MIALYTFSGEAGLNGSTGKPRNGITRIAKLTAAPFSNVVLVGELKAYFRLNFHIIHVHYKQ